MEYQEWQLHLTTQSVELVDYCVHCCILQPQVLNKGHVDGQDTQQKGKTASNIGKTTPLERCTKKCYAFDNTLA